MCHYSLLIFEKNTCTAEKKKIALFSFETPSVFLTEKCNLEAKGKP